MNTDTTVFIVDDDRNAADSLRWLLESAGLSVEVYYSAREFLAGYDCERPGCLVLDLYMPELDGLSLQQKLAALAQVPPIIFITAFGDVPSCVKAMKAGAVDFVEKPVDHQRLLSIVNRAMEKDRQNRLRTRSHPHVSELLQRLTPREREVLDHLYEGRPIKAIAAQLGTGFQTAAKHRSRVLKKLEVENEAELVRLLINGDGPARHQAAEMAGAELSPFTSRSA
jgi:two-component system, LuxR family, response regulator FixJ